MEDYREEERFIDQNPLDEGKHTRRIITASMTLQQHIGQQK